MQRDRFILVYTCLTVLGCGGSSTPTPTPTPTPQPTPQVSSGPKIFLTSRKHVADFKNDPYLNGDSAIHKADDFCNTDPNRPDAHVYKALLLDGVNRDAKALTDWVLKPSTTYYRPHDDIVIGTTTTAAIFGAAYAPLTNSIGGTISPADTGTSVWTGIANSADFTAGECCNGWSDMTNSWTARWAVPTATDGSAFGTNGLVGCAVYEFWIYCVEQP
jgi:hypothetical protein